MRLPLLVNRGKNFPSIYAFDENIVREALIAGLIDSDEFVQKHNILTVSIPSMYIPTKCGIFTVCRLLGLNVSILFRFEH